MLLLTILLFISLLANFILAVIMWLNGNAEKRLAAVIKHQSAIIHNGQDALAAYIQKSNSQQDELHRQAVQIGQKKKLIEAYEKILDEHSLLPGLSN